MGNEEKNNDHSTETLKNLFLEKSHIEHQGRMVDFAGYKMPVQYADGILKEHLHTRSQAGLFDNKPYGAAHIIAQ